MVVRTLVAAQIFQLSDADPLRLTTDAAGQTLVLAVEAVDDVPPEAWSPTLLRMRARKPHRYTVYSGGAAFVTQPLDERFTDVQRLPGDRWLLVRGRAAGPDDPNASVLGPDGRVERAFHVGDGIAHVQADDTGRLWVGYYDEGVFGPSPPGDAGLAAFDPAGEVIFRYNDLHDLPPIDSCYALNVASATDVWFYYYSAFTLVHLRDGAIAGHWSDLPVRGVSAFATDGKHLLAAGSYGEEDLFWRVDLAREGADARQAVQAVSPDGQLLSAGPAHGRGPYLFFRDRGWWWRLDVRDAGSPAPGP